MSLTLLLDMDDTLLANDMEHFLPAYLHQLGAHLQGCVPQDQMIPALMAGTKAMVQKRLPEKTLETAFDEVFYPRTGQSKAQLSGRLEDFYSRVYPALKSVTRVKPEAVEFVDWAFAQAYSVVIATNPLFPRSAIEQRLDWAGLPLSKYPFRLVTSFEQFHFSKPNPAYYAEILGQLGWPEQTAVMIGNSLEDDIQPARALGLPAFHLREEACTDGGDAGGFGRLKDWLKQIETGAIVMPQTPQALRALLASTPAALETLAARLDRIQWNVRPRPQEWSLGEIFCHLRDVDVELNLPRLLRIQQEDSPFISAEATDVWAEERHYLLEDPGLALEKFIQARTKLLQAMDRLSPQDWSRPARHAIFGPTTLSELLSFSITHDQNHIRQGAKNIRWLQGS